MCLFFQGAAVLQCRVITVLGMRSVLQHHLSRAEGGERENSGTERERAEVRWRFPLSPRLSAHEHRPGISAIREIKPSVADSPPSYF